MSLGAVALHGAHHIRVHQDSLSQLPLTPELFSGAGVVIGQLPKSLDALREIAQLAALSSSDDVTLLLGAGSST